MQPIRTVLDTEGFQYSTPLDCVPRIRIWTFRVLEFVYTFYFFFFKQWQRVLTFRVPVMWRRCGTNPGFGFVGSSRGSDGRFGGRAAADVVIGHWIIGGTARRHSFFFGRRTVSRIRTVGQPRETRRSAASRWRLSGGFQRTSVVLVTFKLFHKK